MRKAASIAFVVLILTGAVAAHAGEKHAAKNASSDAGQTNVWTGLSSAYPSQTMTVVLVEIGVVSLLTFLAVRHRLQLRSK